METDCNKQKSSKFFRAGAAVSLLGNELYLFVVNADLFFVILVPDPSPLI